jgi:predicted NBD/HSP70 family sugar kinase
MKVEEIKKWIKNAKPNESVIYFTGHMVEDREWDLGRKKEINEMASAFMLAAQQGEIDLFQNKIKEGDPSNKPIYEYIAKKLKK